MTPPVLTRASPPVTRAGTASRVRFAADLARHGARTALVAGDVEVGYDELADRVDVVRRQLGDAQQLVGLRPAPTVEFVVAYLAALAGGHAVLLAKDETLPRAYGATVEMRDGAHGSTGAASADLHPDLSLLLSTSGSTGSPKLVRLSAANLDANAASIADYLGLRNDDRAITTLPLDYCYGLSVLHSHLAVGASVVLTDRSVTDPGFWPLARAAGVTSYAGVPYTFELLDASGWPELPTLRRVTQAGGRLAPDRVRAAAARGRAEGWDFYVMYGQTEATARMAYLPPHLAETHAGSIGVAIPGGSFRLEPLDSADLGSGDDADVMVGELVYSGPNVMMGYARSVADLSRGPELTELRTGDLARCTEDGLFEVVGRRSRFAKLFGQRVDLERVETLLALDGHVVACAEGAGGAGGSHLAVAVAGEPGPRVLGEVTARAAEVAAVPLHAVRAVAVDDLPRLPNGKVDQRAVAALTVEGRGGRSPLGGRGGRSRPSRDLVEGAGGRGGRSRPSRDRSPEETVEDAIAASYAAVLGHEQVSPDDTFVGLGGDSLSYVELAVRLEKLLDQVSADWPDRTVRDLAAAAPEPGRPRSRWVRLDTSIVLRALSIIFIVGTHTNVFLLLGGAHLLFGVAGANFARFQLTADDPAERWRGILRSIARVAVPTVTWTAIVLATVGGGYAWTNLFLVNRVFGNPHWDSSWELWFVESLVQIVVVVGLLVSVPAVVRLERRSPYWFATALLALTLVPRLWADWSGWSWDVIHTATFVAWLFVGGWAGAQARSTAQRLLVTALVLLGTVGFCDEAARNALIFGGMVALIWLPTVPWPRFATGAVGLVASSSLWIYLVHWQIYPHLEYRWALGGLLASVTAGICAWLLVTAATTRLRPRPSANR